MRGNAVEALHGPSAEVCIIPECLMDTFVGSKPLTPTDEYFKSSSGLFFQCQGIARDVPIIIDKIEVRLDFHVYDIIDFDLLLGLPLEKLLASHGSLDEKLRETGSATATRHLENHASSRAKPAQGDDAYISIHIIRVRSLGSSRIL